VDNLWATKSEDIGLIVHAISFQVFNLCGPDPPTLQTDGQTDDMHSQDRALHYSALRGKTDNLLLLKLQAFAAN